ncbi:hypothetical protein BX600DRAFT_513120 [Xylariales sp. PMI_506]|nr:hypothetical protein BX600DRAFT_513120 [Xylariales sp. PMI_506]
MFVGDSLISTEPGAPYAAFAPGPVGSITRTFTLISDIVHWINPAFFSGESSFCQDQSGQVYAPFVQTTDLWPPKCTPVSLEVYRVEQCVNGTICGVNGDVPPISGIPTSQNIFPLSASPTGEVCSPVTLSWVPAPNPTFL